ncbi:MAG: hypothetical protein S0880_11765 [Actinomycetota bacterium]|nr:hypothetical protein [Actinomycetota bacterium]
MRDPTPLRPNPRRRHLVGRSAVVLGLAATLVLAGWIDATAGASDFAASDDGSSEDGDLPGDRDLPDEGDLRGDEDVREDGDFSEEDQEALLDGIGTVLLALAGVAVFIVVGGVVVLIVRSRPVDEPPVDDLYDDADNEPYDTVAPQRLPRRTPEEVAAELDDVADRARRVAGLVSNVMDAPDASTLSDAWRDLRDHMGDVERRIDAARDAEPHAVHADELDRLHHHVATLADSLETYVSLVMHPEGTTDPDRYVRMVEGSMEAVGHRRRVLERAAVDLGATGR